MLMGIYLNGRNQFFNGLCNRKCTNSSCKANYRKNNQATFAENLGFPKIHDREGKTVLIHEAAHFFQDTFSKEFCTPMEHNLTLYVHTNHEYILSS